MWNKVIKLVDVEYGSKKLYFAMNDVFMGDVLMKEDGYYDFWPELRGGYWDSYSLRAIADMLDELNKDWHDSVQEFFNG